MNCFCFKNLKAAYLSAAFLFLSAAQAEQISSFENIKNKTAELLSLKQKDKAIQLVINYSKTERSKAYRAEAGELLFNIGQSFLTKEAQEEYETSLNDTLENEKKSLKSAENCLKLDALNLDCLIQKARILYRQHNKKNFESTIEEIKAQVFGSSYATLFQLFLERSGPDFKNKQIINSLPQTPGDRTLFYLIFELERSFEAKNYSRAREVLTYCEKHYSGWPDLAFYKNRLNSESSEKFQKSEDDLLNIYVNKCKSISHSAARRFRYDFDLCNRGKKT
jgi:hypothetical protein